MNREDIINYILVLALTSLRTRYNRNRQPDRPFHLTTDWIGWGVTGNR